MTGIAKRTQRVRKNALRVVIALVAIACFIPFLVSSLNPAKAADTTTPTDSDIPTEVTQNNGLYLGKSATVTDDQRGAEITLSQYATGQVQTTVEKKPSDVVLLLDGSQSMTSTMPSLITAVNNYIDQVAEAATANDVDTRFSVILYSGDTDESVAAATKTIVSLSEGKAKDSAAVSAAKAKVSKIKAGKGTDSSTSTYSPGNGTMTGTGMLAAYQALNAVKDDGNNKVTLLFTDGVPGASTAIGGWYTKGGCATGKSYNGGASCSSKSDDPVYEANLAIKYSDQIKEELGGTVFSLGFFSSDDSKAILSGAADADGAMWSDQKWTSKAPVTKTVNSYQRRVSLFGCGFMGLFACYETVNETVTLPDVSGAQATRRFLEAVSSDADFKTATSKTGLMTDATIPNWSTSSNQYMNVISDAGDIKDAFASTIEVPHDESDLAAGSKSTAADFASKYFDVPTDASDIKVYEEAVKSVELDSSGVVTKINWSGTVTPVTVASNGEDGVHVELASVDGNSGLKVTGWDYAANYVGAHADSATTNFFGKRLIVRFTETAKRTTAGTVSTNDTDNSVVTDDDGTVLGKYPTPDPVTIKSLYDGAWIPDCDTSKNLKNGLCLGKSAKASTNAAGAQRSADIAMSAYSTGGLADDGTQTEAEPVDIYYVLDYSNIPDQLNTNGASGAKYGTQWKDESTAIQKVLTNAISNVQNDTVTSRIDITTYAGSAGGGTAGAVKNVLPIGNSMSESALTTAKAAIAGTTCTTSGCTGSAAPTGTSAQLGTAMKSVLSRVQASTSSNPKLVVVMSPPTGLGNYSWDGGMAGCSTGENKAGIGCFASSDPLVQADQAIAAAQEMKAAGATVLTYSGIENSGAEGAGWTGLTRGAITAVSGDLTLGGTLQGRQMQELVSSNVWGVTQMGISSDVKVVDDLADVPTSGTSKVAFGSGSESDLPGTANTSQGQGQGYFYASVLSDKSAMKYFEESVGDLVQRVEIPKQKDSPDVTDGITIADYASAYFETNTPAADVKVYEQEADSLDADGNPVFVDIPTQIAGSEDSDADTPTQIDSAVTVKAVTDSKTGTTGYTVSGWDFAKNYVGKHKDTSFFGKRLVIKFTETATKQFLGGANVPTNETGSKHDISGAYASTGFDGSAASAATTLNSFPATSVNVDLIEVKTATKNGKGYYGGALNMEKTVSLTDADGNALDLAPLKDGSRNNDFVQVELSFDSGDKATSAGMIYSSGASSDAAGYVASQTPQWVSGNKLTATSPVFLGSKDLTYNVIAYLEPVTSFALESDATAMSKDALDEGKVSGAQMDTAKATVYSLLPWIQWNDTQLELGDVNDFTQNLSFNASSPWRWTGGYSNTSSNADKIPSDGTAGEAETNVVTEDVTAVPQFTFVTGHGDKPSKDPGDNSTNKVTDFAPTKNSDFTVTVKLTGNDSNNTVTAYTANSKPSGTVVTVAQSPSNKALNVADSIENGYAAKTGYDFRVWVVDNYVDPGFPTTCVTVGNMCVGKEVSAVTTAADGKRTATVTLTAYETGTTSGAADTSVNDKTKLADFASAYFGTDGDSRKVKVWEQSASKLGTTVEFHRNPVLLSDPNTALMSTPAMAIYPGNDDSTGIQVQSTPSATGNPGFNVQNFDYAENYVGARSGSGNLGKRLVVQFVETVDDCFIGGNDVPSNEASTPGIYTTAGENASFPSSAYKQIAQFDDPEVDVPASAACATFSDGKAYDLGALDSGTAGLSSLIRSADGSSAFSFGKIGSNNLQYNQFATTTFTFTNKATGKEVATYTIPSAQIGGNPVFKWTDDSAKIQGTKDVTYAISESVTLGADGPVDVTPTSGNEVTVYALVPTLSAADSVTSVGEETSLTQSVTKFDWRWIGATTAGDKKSDVSLVVSEKPAVQKLVYSLVRGTTPSAGTTGGTVNTTVAPSENSDFKAGVVLTTAASAGGTTVYPADIDRSLVTRSNGDVVDGDKISSFSNGHDTEFDDYDFRIWVTGQKVSSLPLTGGLGTGRIFLMVCAGMALIAGTVAAVRKFALSRNRD